MRFDNAKPRPHGRGFAVCFIKLLPYFLRNYQLATICYQLDIFQPLGYNTRVQYVYDMLVTLCHSRKEVRRLLSIYFGDMPSAIYNPEVYFKNTYDEDWLLDDFSKKVIKKVDKSEVLDRNAIKSPVLGIIPPTALSGGTKTLILMKFCPDLVFNASACGDNCAKFILELAKHQDLTINLRHIMNFGNTKFQAKILNSGALVHNMDEFLHAAAQYV